MVGLIDPLSIGPVRLGNRIVMPPMATELASPDGEVTDGLVKHYVSRAMGPGLIVVEHSFVATGGRCSPRQLGIHDDMLTAGLARIAKGVHTYGTPVAIQINHAGRATTLSICGAQPVAPSPIPASVELETPRVLSEEEIDGLIEVFGLASRRAVEAGFDGVEVHGAHGYLLNQFASPLSNTRSDRYGGSFENRVRFPIRVVRKIKKVIGANILLYRMGADDMTPGGFTIEEGKRFAVKLVGAGVDVIDVSGGMCGDRPFHNQGFFVHLASEIRSAANVPVIGVGGIRDPFFANDVVRNGEADLVAVGRAQLTDPSWATKALDAIRSTVQL